MYIQIEQFIMKYKIIKRERERERESYEDERDLELREEAEVSVEERDWVGDLYDVVLRWNAAEEDGVDGGGFVLESVED